MSSNASDTDLLATQLNSISKSLDDGNIEDNKYGQTEVEDLCNDMQAVGKSQTAKLYAGTSLSEREATIKALDTYGLNPLTIALVLTVSSSYSIDGEAVRDSLETIREKYETAAVTYKLLDEHISRPKNWECPRCEALTNLNDYITAPKQCPNCNYKGFLESGKPK